MIFTSFDIDNAIAACNRQRRKQCTRDEFNFLEALAPQNIMTLSCANELLNNATKLGMIESSRANLPDQLREQLLAENFRAVRSSLNELRIQQESQLLHDWYVEQQRRLCSADLWPQLMAQPRSKLLNKAILALQTQWLNNPHCQFAAHTSYAIALIIQNIIPMIENYAHFANTELRYHRFKLPAIIRRAYHRHLNNEKEKLKIFKQTLCDNLLERLKLANLSGNLCYDDLIKHSTEWLSSQQLIQQRHGMPLSKRYGFNHNTFPLFIEFIAIDGNTQQLQKLRELKCFTNDDDFTANIFPKGVILLPRIIAASNLVPLKPVLFPKLFSQQHYRFQFMQKNIWLIANLRMLPLYNLKSLDVNNAAQHILSLERQLLTAHQELNNLELNGWQILFKSSNSRFKHLWQNYFDNAQHQLLDKKIDLLDHIYTHSRKGISFLLEHKAIEKVIDSITAESGLHMMNQQRIEQFCILKKKLLKEIRKPAPDTTKKIEKAPDNNPFTIVKREPPIEDTQTLDYQQKLFTLFNNIQIFKLDECNFDETLSSLKNLIITVTESNNANSKSRLQSLYAKLFDQYLRHCINFNNTTALIPLLNRITRIEELLLSQAPDYIQQRIKGLRDLRTQHDWFALFIIKCRSYLASCPQQTTPYLISNSNIFTMKTCKQTELTPAATAQLVGGE